VILSNKFIRLRLSEGASSTAYALSMLIHRRDCPAFLPSHNYSAVLSSVLAVCYLSPFLQGTLYLLSLLVNHERNLKSCLHMEYTAACAFYFETIHQGAIIDYSCISGTSTLETCYSNFIARQLYAQKCLKY